jgi:phage-related protein
VKATKCHPSWNTEVDIIIVVIDMKTMMWMRIGTNTTSSKVIKDFMTATDTTARTTARSHISKIKELIPHKMTHIRMDLIFFN